MTRDTKLDRSITKALKLLTEQHLLERLRGDVDLYLKSRVSEEAVKHEIEGAFRAVFRDLVSKTLNKKAGAKFKLQLARAILERPKTRYGVDTGTLAEPGGVVVKKRKRK